MNAIDIFLLGVALSMDACAVSLTDGMTFPKMKRRTAMLIALLFGVFQGVMPLIGYFITDIFASRFTGVFESVSSVLSFLILAFLGAKMIFDGVKEIKEKKKADCSPSCPACERAGGEEIGREKSLPVGKILLQAVATSIDALAVGVSLRMAALSGGLAFGIFGTVGVICAVTFALSLAAVYIGKAVGAGLADKAEIVGGAMLILIGVKLLLEGIL